MSEEKTPSLRLKIQAKLFIAFLAVGLLSIFVGVFTPLWIISRLSPRETEDRITDAKNMIFSLNPRISEEIQELSEKLNQDGQLGQVFTQNNEIAFKVMLKTKAEKFDYELVFEDWINVSTNKPMMKRRCVKILDTYGEYEKWKLKFQEAEKLASSRLRLFAWQHKDQTLYSSGDVIPINNPEGQVLGGLLVVPSFSY